MKSITLNSEEAALIASHYLKQYEETLDRLNHIVVILNKLGVKTGPGTSSEKPAIMPAMKDRRSRSVVSKSAKKDGNLGLEKTNAPSPKLGRGRPRIKALPNPDTPKRKRGRPRVRPLPDPNAPKRKRGRPRVRPLPDPNAPKKKRGRPRIHPPIDKNAPKRKRGRPAKPKPTVQKEKGKPGRPSIWTEFVTRKLNLGAPMNLNDIVAAAMREEKIPAEKEDSISNSLQVHLSNLKNKVKLISAVPIPGRRGRYFVLNEWLDESGKLKKEFEEKVADYEE